MRAQAEWGRKENTTSFKRNATFRCHRSNVSSINVDKVLFTTLQCAETHSIAFLPTRIVGSVCNCLFVALKE